MIDFDNVSFAYDNDVEALHDVAVHVDKGEFAFIVGPTGEGKTTFLKLIYREVVPTSGRVLVAGTDVGRLPRRRVPYLRRRIGVVFQDFRLLSDSTITENILFALEAMRVPRREMRRRTEEVLRLVGLGHRMDAFPGELSAGEQQRACIARAIANYPPILLADEPTGNLDPDTSLEIVMLLRDINIRGTTILMATHDRHIVDTLNQRVISLHRGRIVRDVPRGLYYAPYD
ncbi:MAG: cell division ATP-binding protein FtsE [Armatimonadota bacterium]|nr:MAG: cell division ATP-binding protein FtsE [Armatimonadota bacterium]